jgi:membrane fusion protein (multidrug efflux system)
MSSAEASPELVERAEAQAAAPAASKKKLVIGLVIAVVALGMGVYYVAHRGLESTDDAQTDADVVAVPARISGTVLKLHFADNQKVKQGELLVELDPVALQAKLAQADATLASARATAEAADADAELSKTNAVGDRSIAKASVMSASAGAASLAAQIHEGEAQLQSAQASLAQATTNRDRDQSLFGSGAIAKAELDKSLTAYDVASAAVTAARARLATAKQNAAQANGRVVEASARAEQVGNVEPFVRQAQARANAAHAAVDTAKAARDLAAIDLSYARVYAPHDGVVSKRTINEGQTVNSGTTIVQLVTPDVWVTANFKETQVGRMHVGQPAHFTVDAFSGVEIQGEIESLSGATGARFSLLPPDNATGNFTKVVQRVPVRVKVHEVPPGVVLRPGMSVDLTVDTRS